MELVATSLFGLEKFVAEDIDALGLPPPADHRRPCAF